MGAASRDCDHGSEPPWGPVLESSQESPRFPLKGSFKGDIDSIDIDSMDIDSIDINIDIDIDIDSIDIDLVGPLGFLWWLTGDMNWTYEVT